MFYSCVGVYYTVVNYLLLIYSAFSFSLYYTLGKNKLIINNLNSIFTYCSQDAGSSFVYWIFWMVCFCSLNDPLFFQTVVKLIKNVQSATFKNNECRDDTQGIIFDLQIAFVAHGCVIY